MLRRETLVLIKCLKRHSRPSSRSWMHNSMFSSWLCTALMLSDLLVLCSTNPINAASTSANSFLSVWSAEATVLWCTSLETNDQPTDFVFGPETKKSKDSVTLREVVWTSFNKLNVVVVSWSPLKVAKVHLFCITFKALWIALLTTFLEAKYFLTSFVRPISP